MRGNPACCVRASGCVTGSPPPATERTLSQRTQLLPRNHPRAFLVLAAVIWWLLYQSLVPVSEAVVAALPVDRDSHLGGALQFFFYDTPKVLLLLTAVVFVMGMVNSYFTPERTRALLAGRTEGVANVMAASLGVVTPFCSTPGVAINGKVMHAGGVPSRGKIEKWLAA